MTTEYYPKNFQEFLSIFKTDDDCWNYLFAWADIFTRKIYRDIVIDSFKFCQQNKGLEIFAYVIMSNHVHLLARAANNNLSDVVRDLRRHTSKKIIEAVKNPPSKKVAL